MQWVRMRTHRTRVHLFRHAYGWSFHSLPNHPEDSSDDGCYCSDEDFRTLWGYLVGSLSCITTRREAKQRRTEGGWTKCWMFKVWGKRVTSRIDCQVPCQKCWWGRTCMSPVTMPSIHAFVVQKRMHGDQWPGCAFFVSRCRRFKINCEMKSCWQIMVVD